MHINAKRVTAAYTIDSGEEDGKSYSTVYTVRGMLQPVFQMAANDDIKGIL